MPRYFFHTADGGQDRDPNGMELADDHAARLEAIRYGGALLRDQPEIVVHGRDLRVAVVDQDRQLLMTVVTMAIDARDPPSGET